MILDFVKGFLTLFLLIKILLYFVPKNTFEKYVSFFAGVILIIGLLYPLLQMSGREDLILEKIRYDFQEEELEETGKQMMEDYYNKILKETSGVEEVVIETIKIEGNMQAGGIDE